MRLSRSAVMAIVAAGAASAFQTHVPRPHAVAGPSTTSLNAFQLKEGETKNMFEGPAPLVRERDACGVGFIVNPKSGGESPWLGCENLYELGNGRAPGARPFFVHYLYAPQKLPGVGHFY